MRRTTRHLSWPTLALALALLLVQVRLGATYRIGESYVDTTFDYNMNPEFNLPFDSETRSLLRTYYVVDHKGIAIEYGTEFPNNAKLKALGYQGPFAGQEPAGPSYGAALPYDVNALGAGIPISHVGLFYNPWGHFGGPDDTNWLHSHWDVHFHLLTPYETENIQCAPPDEDKPFCPTGGENNVLFAEDKYALPDTFMCESNGIQYAGIHCAMISNKHDDFTEYPLLNFGVYKGKVNFLEPMLSLRYLEKITIKTCYDWPQLECYRKEGLYPAKMCIKPYGNDLTRVSFEKLVWKEADCPDVEQPNTLLSQYSSSQAFMYVSVILLIVAIVVVILGLVLCRREQKKNRAMNVELMQLTEEERDLENSN